MPWSLFRHHGLSRRCDAHRQETFRRDLLALSRQRLALMSCGWMNPLRDVAELPAYARYSQSQSDERWNHAAGSAIEQIQCPAES